MQIKTLNVGPLGTCCYILHQAGGEGCVVIDPGGEPERILAAAEGSIRAILLTHGHFDHIGAASALMQPGVELVIHRLDAPLLSDPRLNVSRMVGMRITAPEPTRCVAEGSSFTCAGITFTVLHTPGHTQGSVCYLAEDCLFTGDTMFHYSHGRTDFPGGSDTDMADSLRRLQPLAQQYAIYPGHEG